MGAGAQFYRRLRLISVAQLLVATRGRKVDGLARGRDQTCSSISSILRNPMECGFFLVATNCNTLFAELRFQRLSQRITRWQP